MVKDGKLEYYHILFTHNDVTKCKSVLGSRLVLVNTDVDLYGTYVKDENEFNYDCANSTGALIMHQKSIK
jgi:hypothetical protein